MRRLIFLLLVAGLLAFSWVRCSHLRVGQKRIPEKYTPAEGPKLTANQVQGLSALDAEYTRLVEAVVPSVVSITTTKRVRLNSPAVIDPREFFFGTRQRTVERKETSLGSGVIVSKEGHILTNHHVIAGMEEIRVQLTDGRVEPAQLIGSDPETDIAVLRVTAKNIEPLSLGDSDGVRVGQMVFAVGNPFGLQETVTQGIISGKGRRAMRDSGVELLQTDAAVNRGNSGGPLLNLRGEIIGINSAIYSETGGWLGISFAIPSNTARDSMESILKIGRAVRSYLGVQMSEVTGPLAQTFGLRDTRGALVADVLPGSPAERAGLKPGDVIRSFNGQAIDDPMALRARLAATGVGAKVQLGLIREGKETTVAAEIAEAPSDFAIGPQTAPPAPQPSLRTPDAAPSAPSASPANVLAGVQVGAIPPTVRDALPENVRGVLVTQLQPDSPAAEKLLVGDVIEEFNNRPIRSVEDFDRYVQALGPQDRAVLYIARGRSRSFVVVTP